jgi:hypothetical protein
MAKKDEGSHQVKGALITGLFALLAACMGGTFMIVNTMLEKGFNSSLPGVQAASSPTPDRPSQAVPVVPTSAPVRKTLFEDDFSDPTSGWPSSSDADKYADYSGDGRYLIQVIAAQHDVWVHPGEDFADVRIEVDATKSFGPDNNDFGIICRFQDSDNFYYLIVSSDGYQVIGKYQDGDSQYLSAEKMQPTTAMDAGNATNHIRADCNGSTLTLYANGRQLASVTDSSFSSGDIGLIVGTFDEPDVGILFDDLIVYEP